MYNVNVKIVSDFCEFLFGYKDNYDCEISPLIHDLNTCGNKNDDASKTTLTSHCTLYFDHQCKCKFCP